MREGLRDEEVERQRRHRQLVREKEETTRLLVVQEKELEVEREMSSREISVVLSKIEDFFTMKMQGCLGTNSRLKIMECFLEDERVSPFLPQYYPRGQDAKAQFEFLKNYQLELDALKGVQLADMLARKAIS